ncbi:hypothetical protein L360_04917 [Enterobacter sp. MGH 14]|nr:hypothetical protein L360_04917 [Enterobacter sp. MGH 14]
MTSSCFNVEEITNDSRSGRIPFSLIRSSAPSFSNCMSRMSVYVWFPHNAHADLFRNPRKSRHVFFAFPGILPPFPNPNLDPQRLLAQVVGDSLKLQTSRCWLFQILLTEGGQINQLIFAFPLLLRSCTFFNLPEDPEVDAAITMVVFDETDDCTSHPQLQSASPRPRHENR